ncbi:MAG: glycosyltransferase family 9 protein, partial [Verrucomicrobiota bacterium]
MKPENVINLHDYSTQQFGSAASRARWYCSFIHPQLTPVRPAAIDRRLKMPRFDFQRYAVIAPCSANEWRNWPAIHWRRLILHLREAGLEVVAVGTAKQEAFIAAICAGTTAYWVVDHSAEWLSDAMLGASVVVANDSAIAHFGGLLDVPTIAIHSLFGPEILWDCTNVKSALPKTNCAFCQSMPQK